MRLVGALAVLLVVGFAASTWTLREAWSPQLPGDADVADGRSLIVARRLPANPIIRHTMDARLREEARRYGYVNVNGPSLIRVPAWVENRLGNYYLYFAHHKGEFIRMAYADRLAGPWTIHGPGVLELDASLFTNEAPTSAGLVRSALDLWRVTSLTEFIALSRVGLSAQQAAQARKRSGLAGSAETRPHIASPDVIVDHGRREIRMYFHGLVERHLQMTRVATSSDGVRFRVRPELLTAPYLRVFEHQGGYYGLAMPGLLYRSADGLSDFRVRERPLFAASTRHAAVWTREGTLHVFYTRVGDAPERILCSTIDATSADWDVWAPSPPLEILRPELPWEGADLPVEPSMRGESPVPVRQLRDPAVFVEDDQAYLLYSVAGEQAIAIAQLNVRTALD
jgi:hypothetical protein